MPPPPPHLAHAGLPRRKTGWWQKCQHFVTFQGVPKAPRQRQMPPPPWVPGCPSESPWVIPPQHSRAPQGLAPPHAGGPMGVAQPDRGPPRGSLGAQ